MIMATSRDWEVYWWAMINAPCQCQITIHILEVEWRTWKNPENLLGFSLTLDIHFCPMLLLDIPLSVYRLFYGESAEDTAVDDIPF